MRIERRSILVNGLIVACVGLVLLHFYRSVTPTKQSTLPESVIDAIGLAVIFFGQFLRISARGYKHREMSEKAALITTGPYVLVRNPMYLGSFLIGLGIVIMLLKIWMVPVYILLFLLWYRWQIYNEEKHLVQKFGQAYLDYLQTTPRFFPRFRDLAKLNLKKCIPLRLKWIKMELTTILGWVLVVGFFEDYYEFQWYGFGVLLRESIFLFVLVTCFLMFLFVFRENQ